jgi:hypothetical protein
MSSLPFLDECNGDLLLIDSVSRILSPDGLPERLVDGKRKRSSLLGSHDGYGHHRGHRRR